MLLIASHHVKYVSSDCTPLVSIFRHVGVKLQRALFSPLAVPATWFHPAVASHLLSSQYFIFFNLRRLFRFINKNELYSKSFFSLLLLAILMMMNTSRDSRRKKEANYNYLSKAKKRI